VQRILLSFTSPIPPVVFPAREEIENVRFGANFIESQRYLRGQFNIERYFLLFEAEVGDFYGRLGRS
jgi:hypothetical protein